MTDQTPTAASLRAGFVKKISNLSHRQHIHDVFSEFCELSFCCLAQRGPMPESRRDLLEARYLEIIARHQDKQDIHVYSELLGEAALGIQLGGSDFLGGVAAELEVLNVKIGQFFTPYEISRLMAESILGDA